MSAAPHAQCYAVRRVNPFEGVLQIVEIDGARAYSPNGRVWQVQVLAERPDHTWRSFSHVAPVEQFFNFGLWDADQGLQRVPANPVMDIGAMSDAADALTAALAASLEALPFPLVDRYECWATDHRDRPVALLATSEDRDRVQSLRVARWQATRLAEHEFVSPALLHHGVAAHGDLGPRQHAEQLERQVRQLGQRKAWFEREADGSGRRIQPVADPATLAPATFPALGLATDWQDELAAELAQDYLDWLAPRLLTLQTLDDSSRRRLEHRACARPVELAEHYRLFPRILDTECIAAARVAARLQRSV